jgi:hypothetical protein
MTFKATIREIDNGLIIELPGSRFFDYSEIHVSTFAKAVALVVAKYAESHPQEPQKEPSKEAMAFSKISGLIGKDYMEFKEIFEKNYPGEDILKALEAAHCQIIEKKVVFVGG